MDVLISKYNLPFSTEIDPKSYEVSSTNQPLKSPTSDTLPSIFSTAIDLPKSLIRYMIPSKYLIAA